MTGWTTPRKQRRTTTLRASRPTCWGHAGLTSGRCRRTRGGVRTHGDVAQGAAGAPWLREADPRGPGQARAACQRLAGPCLLGKRGWRGPGLAPHGRCRPDHGALGWRSLPVAVFPVCRRHKRALSCRQFHNPLYVRVGYCGRHLMEWHQRTFGRGQRGAGP